MAFALEYLCETTHWISVILLHNGIDKKPRYIYEILKFDPESANVYVMSLIMYSSYVMLLQDEQSNFYPTSDKA